MKFQALEGLKSNAKADDSNFYLLKQAYACFVTSVGEQKQKDQKIKIFFVAKGRRDSVISYLFELRQKQNKYIDFGHLYPIFWISKWNSS